MKKNTHVTFEINDNKGDTIMKFIFDKSNNKIVKSLDCSHISTDKDDIFDTDNPKMIIEQDYFLD